MSGMTSIPIIGGMFDDSDERAMAELERNRKLYEGIDVPNLTWRDLAPELYSSDSANYDLVEEDPVIRSKQTDVLAKLAGLADNGLSDVDEAGYLKARQVGDQAARSNREAVLQDAQSRGVAGSGLEFAMKEIANQGGAQRTQEAAMQQAADSAKSRAMYTTAYGDALGQTRNQDLQANRANTDIINQFNMANTQARNQTNQMNTQTKNDAQRYNNEGRTNTTQQNFNNQMTRANGIAGVNTQMANAYAAQNAANTADRNMWTQIGASAATGGLAAIPAAKKKPTGGGNAGQGYGDYSGYV